MNVELELHCVKKKKTVACSFLRKCVATSRVVLEKRKKKRTESVVHSTNQTYFLFKKWWDAQHGDGDEIEDVSILSFLFLCVCVLRCLEISLYAAILGR